MGLFTPSAPLAERVRPRSLEEVVGQEHLTGPGKPFRRMLEIGRLHSMILWGPPGVGKTTLARVLAQGVRAEFIPLSAVAAGVKEVREAVARAEAAARVGRRTVLFLDEVHRFNKAQQDALLPHVESGLLTLIGATTENPSFEVNPALRSRARVYVLKPLEKADLLRVLQRALEHPEGLPGVAAEAAALDLIAAGAMGDARRALAALELAAELGEGRVTVAAAREALGAGGSRMDKGGEAFYDLTSALHKAIRGSHVDAALYYLARLVEGGADPMYVARRLVRIAAEDVGLADPNALRLAIAAKEAYAFLGSPEGELALAEVAVYLALAPKSNSVYVAWKRARDAVQAHPHAEVPLHLRNAPTGLLKALGYGEGYAYYHDDPEGSFAQAYLPEALEGASFFEPRGEGWEARLRERFAALKKRFAEAKRGREG
ncbi:replication-associated recombination protein A [Marinithermus hydrothermalis]|uniref:AAA ATPase central domain protein n=1 Tax=Marinithermus hydrothermalis (strain DSM 14884 / JCM 11576 / T1) TaxID=869210 RepID=F2NPG0_MARHT|nr:replication-associated recombination protein A [Marinithermus hydrothermalis]AEB12241.1 AAA ATPase central domain protein [Marinithermus hydrothermalis DSM 14884]